MRWNFWSSSTDPSNASPVAAQPKGAVPTATPTPAAATPSSTPTPSPTSSPAADPSDLITRFERTLQDEEKYQEMQYPSAEQVPTCMTLLDEFLMCYALVPQLRNVYRHGELRDCTYKFDDFKYCMSLKGEDVEERRRLWIRRRAEWWASRRVGPSSEDVWDARDEPLENFPPLFEDNDNENEAPTPAAESM